MKTSQRIAYGEELLQLCRENERVVVLDADLCTGTQSQIVEKGMPERFFDMGIGEQNMIGVAAGFALSGKIPFCHSFAVFTVSRPFEQIRQSVCLPNLNVKVTGASCGLSDYADGATHQCFEDVAIMRVLPNMTIFSPADANEARKVVRLAAGLPGPAYIRINRNEIPVVTEKDAQLEIGKPTLMAEGDEVAICASGHMVHFALEARKILAVRGIGARVLNFATIKPLDAASVRAAVAPAKRVVTVEEHSVIGGLSAAIMATLAENPLPIRCIGIQDKYGESSDSYEKLLVQYGLTPDRIAEMACK
ncbi:MAG: transketolase family protein [Planctomycetota bacterium]|jgi:transketolase|nr:transketolase family protein [Planctomycetota bacterium]